MGKGTLTPSKNMGPSESDLCAGGSLVLYLGIICVLSSAEGGGGGGRTERSGKGHVLQSIACTNLLAAFFEDAGCLLSFAVGCWKNSVILEFSPPISDPHPSDPPPATHPQNIQNRAFWSACLRP